MWLISSREWPLLVAGKAFVSDTGNAFVSER
jgi:hypothetical protein